MMDKLPQTKYEEKVVITFDHPAVTGTTTWKIWKCPAGKAFVLDRASYINPTGLAEDTTNTFAGTVQNGSTVMATLFNTDSDGAGTNTLAADTFVEGTLSATATDLWLAADDIISLVATEGAVASLPAGRLVLEGRLL
jgi:hypothetical protein